MAEGQRFSYPYGVALVLYPVLAIAMAAGSQKWWGIALIAVAGFVTAFFAWEGLSASEFGKIREKDATLTRLSWRINWLLFFALPPALLATYAIFKRWG